MKRFLVCVNFDLFFVTFLFFQYIFVFVVIKALTA